MENVRLEVKFVNEEDSRKKAHETLKSIFDQKMLNIETIKSLIKQFQNYENQNNFEVFNRIEQTITSSQLSIVRIKELIESLTEIEMVAKKTKNEWTKLTASLNAYGGNLDKLMACNRNISTLKKNLNMYFKNIVDNQVVELRRLMDNDENVLFVFKNIRYLSCLRNQFLEKIKTINRSDKLNIVADHMLPVENLKYDFFDKFYGYFKNVIQLAEERPAFLVKLLRLVEEDDNFVQCIQSQLSNNYQKQKEKDERPVNSNVFQLSRSVTEKKKNEILSKRETIRAEIRESIANLSEFENTSYEFVKDRLLSYLEEQIHYDFKDKNSINLVLDSTLVYSKELVKVHKFVVPCFPKKYEIFELFKSVYLEEINLLVKPFVDEINQNPKENSANVILLARWLDKFDEELKSIGIEISYLEIGAEIKYVLTHFLDHIGTVLDTTIQSIVKKNLEDKNAIKRSKKVNPEEITSYYASDVFQNIFSVVEALSEDIRGDMMLTLNSYVINKLIELEKLNKSNVQLLNHPSDIIVGCIYIMDADNCMEEFPSYAHKMKEILSEQYHKNLKDKFNHLKKEYSDSIRRGSNKVVELLFYDIELLYLSKMFSSQWNSELLTNSFSYFKVYFKGFTKMFKNQNILMSIVRSFLENFLNFYFEEIIHSVRSIFKKEKSKSKDAWNIFTYNLNYIKSFEEQPESKDLTKLKNDAVEEEASSKYVSMDHKSKKYSFPVKLIEESWKTLNLKKVKDLLESDFKVFNNFLDSFKENSLSPFSKDFDIKLDNYVIGLSAKFASALKIVSAENTEVLNQTVKLAYKENFVGEEAKPLLDALLFLRISKISDDVRKMCQKSLMA